MGPRVSYILPFVCLKCGNFLRCFGRVGIFIMSFLGCISFKETKGGAATRLEFSSISVYQGRILSTRALPIGGHGVNITRVVQDADLL